MGSGGACVCSHVILCLMILSSFISVGRLFLSVWVYYSPCMFISLSLCGCLYVVLSLSVSLSVCLTVFVWVGVGGWVSISVCRCLSLLVCLALWLCVSLYTCNWAFSEGLFVFVLRDRSLSTYTLWEFLWLKWGISTKWNGKICPFCSFQKPFTATIDDLEISLLLFPHFCP